MKKSLILAALVLISAGCFAQKNPLVKKAKSLVSSETPDYVAARAAIKEALATEPTAANRALSFTCSAADACIIDNICHNNILL